MTTILKEPNERLDEIENKIVIIDIQIKTLLESINQLKDLALVTNRLNFQIGTIQHSLECTDRRVAVLFEQICQIQPNTKDDGK